MKLLRFGTRGAERPGIIDQNGDIRDLSGIIPDISGSVLCDLSPIQNIDVEHLPKIEADVRLGAPIAHTGKFMCIGLNYADHAEESGMEVPSEPVLFMKASSAICGPNDPIIIPKGSTKTDWEVELGVVIGKPAKRVSEATAMDHVAGYCVVNDVSERAFQLEHEGQWTKGKSCDNFGQIGPYLVTRDEIADPHNLKMWLEVNGERVQDGSTSTMVYGVPHLVSYLSHFMTLHPGDIISTGTPPGVGLGLNPPRYLKAGDNVELGIECLGQQQQTCVAEK